MDGPVYHLEGVVKAKEAGMEDFVGPLDLILHLLAKNKMEIQDIQLSLILDQYLAWMDRRRELDLEVASEFVAMASHLVYIKTRMLLSIHDEEALSELEQLIATLQAHQRQEDYFRLRKVLPQLEEDFQHGQDYLTKTPEVLTPDRNVRYGHSGQDLYRIMVNILRRGGDKVPPMNAFQGLVPGTLSWGPEGGGGAPPVAGAGLGGPAGPVSPGPQPHRGGGHLFGGAGAVQKPPAPSVRRRGGLHRDLCGRPAAGGAGEPRLTEERRPPEWNTDN